MSATSSRSRRRLLGVDAARGIALLGMMAVHLVPHLSGDGSVSLSDQLARGRAAAAFAVLAGVSLALANGGVTPLRGRPWAAAGAGLMVRCVCIAVLGLGLAELGSGLAIILVNYALLFALAVPLLRLRATALVVVAAVTTVTVPLLSHLVRAHLPPLRGGSPVVAHLADPSRLLSELTLTGYYPVLAWIAYLAAGLAVGRLDLADPRMAQRLLLGGAILAVAAFVASRVLLALPRAQAGLPADAVDQLRYGTTPPTSWWWLVIAQPHSTTPFDLAHTIGTALALLGGCLLLAAAAGRWITPLAWVGSMTLTLYTLHVLAVAAAPAAAHPWLVWCLHVAVAFVVAAHWRSASPRGPIEEVVTWPSKRAAAAVRGSGR